MGCLATEIAGCTAIISSVDGREVVLVFECAPASHFAAFFSIGKRNYNSEMMWVVAGYIEALRILGN